MTGRGIAAAALAMLILASVAAAAPSYVEGVARRLPGRDIVYRELHRIDGTHHRVDYRAPDGRAIATQTLDYICSDSAPAFEQYDRRTELRIGARWENGSYLLLRAGQTQPAATGDNLIGSSGFDRFVRANWERLVRGEPLNVLFALPARLQTLALRIVRVQRASPDPQIRIWFEIEPQRPWLRLFVDPVLLGYDASRRLRVYRGLSNLAAADGSALEVEIHYDYPAAPAVRLAETEPSAALPRSSLNPQCSDPQA